MIWLVPVLMGAVALALIARRPARRTLRTAKHVARDPRIPRWLKRSAALGLLPWPGPLDEVVLLGVAAVIGVRYRHIWREHWTAS